MNLPAVTVIGGLAVSTGLTVCVVPCLYLTLITATDRLAQRLRRR